MNIQIDRLKKRFDAMTQAAKKTESVLYFEPLRCELQDGFGALKDVSPIRYLATEKAWRNPQPRITVLKAKSVMLSLAPALQNLVTHRQQRSLKVISYNINKMINICHVCKHKYESISLLYIHY